MLKAEQQVRELEDRAQSEASKHETEVTKLHQELAAKDASYQSSQENLAAKARQAEQKKAPNKQLATLKKQLEEKEKEIKKAKTAADE